MQESFRFQGEESFSKKGKKARTFSARTYRAVPTRAEVELSPFFFAGEDRWVTTRVL